MARSIVTPSTANYLGAAAPMAGPPFTMACWATVVSFATARVMMSMLDDVPGTFSNGHSLMTNTSSFLQVVSTDGSPASATASSLALSTDTWFHACGVWASSTSRKVYANGTTTATNTTSKAPVGVNALQIGRRATLTHEGRLAWATVWDVALTDAEVLALSRGVNPLRIRPQSIASCYPLTGKNSPELDLIGGRPLTVNGTVPYADGPPVRSWR